MQNVPHDARATKKKGKNLTNKNSTSEIFGLTRSLSVQIIAAADQRVAFVDNRSIVTRADEARFAVK